jgi:hypothetical protein
MGRGEATLIAGSGSQTSYSRWGDYSMLSIDPADDETFWYTTEYLTSTGTAWRTRFGAFKVGTAPYMTVTISGPAKAYNSGYYTWCANVSGSGLTPPYTYDWRYSYDGSSYVNSFGTSQCQTANMPLDFDLYLKVTVTDSLGIQGIDYHHTINLDAM